MILTAHNLSCRRGGRLIFADVSFAIEPGEALIVTGDNGAGKSSLISIVAGLLRPSSGTVSLERMPHDATLSEYVGLMGHRDGLKAALTVRENLDYARSLLGEGQMSIDEGLAAVNLSHARDMPVEFLSAGQRRRVALTRLIICSRPIWLMDEPAGALDHASTRALTEIMDAHLNEGGLILAATHQPLGLLRSRSLHLEPPRIEDCDGEWEDDDADDVRLMGFTPKPAARTGK